jgi:hypothetical protein
MATQTKTVEVQGASGLTTGFAAARNGDATGTISSVTVAEISGTGIYTVSVNWDDASAANEPIGDWAVSVGSATGYLGRSNVEFVSGEDDYRLGGVGGADAEAIVDEIENRGITTVAVQSGVTNATTLELIQGDTYDGIGKPLLSFTVAIDYAGWTPTLTIRDADDSVVLTVTGTVASSTSITFSTTAPTGLVFAGCPGSWQGKFDVSLAKDSSETTIAKGVCYVYEDQTRA